jgi:transcription-repair coupling factor (superfamily II helicase)
MGARLPVRVEFLDDEVDSLRHFDPETQRSTERIERLDVLPSHEFPLNAESIKSFRGRYRTRFSGDPTRHAIYRDVSEGLAPAGVESYLPLFFEQLDTLFEYCREAGVVQFGDVAGAAGRFAAEVLTRFEQLGHQADRPLLPPDALYLDENALAAALAERSGIALGPAAAPLPSGRGRTLAFSSAALPELGIQQGRPEPAERLHALPERSRAHPAHRRIHGAARGFDHTAARTGDHRRSGR